MEVKHASPSLCPFFGQVPHEEMPQLKDHVAAKCEAILQQAPNPHLVKVRYGKEVVTVIQDPQVAALFTKYARQDPGNKEHPFKITNSWIRNYLLGTDSLMSCTPEESKQLRSIVINFIKSIEKADTINICESKLRGYSYRRWFPSKQLNLSEEIPPLIASIGIEGIMGFSPEIIEKLSEMMGTITLEDKISESFFGKIRCTASNTINNVQKLICVYKLPGVLRSEISRQLNENQMNGFLKEMVQYAKKKHNLDENDALTPNALNLIVRNYIVVLFAFQETTVSLVKNMIKEMGEHPEAFKEYIKVADELKSLSYEASSQKSLLKREGDKQKMKNFKKTGYANYLSKLNELNDVIQELLRLYSPGGLNRTFENNFVIHDGEFQHFVKENEKIDYSPFYAGRNPHYFENPDIFDPTRFKGEKGEEVLHQNQALMHFGKDAHVCPGQAHAMFQLKIILAFLLSNFEFKLLNEKLTYIAGDILTTKEDILVHAKAKNVVRAC